MEMLSALSGCLVQPREFIIMLHSSIVDPWYIAKLDTVRKTSTFNLILKFLSTNGVFVGDSDLHNPLSERAT